MSLGLLGTIIFFAYVPALMILWYFYHQDFLEPEPPSYVFGTFILGATLSTGMAYILEGVFTLGGMIKPLLPQTAFYVALVAGVVEEPAKALAVYLLPYRMRQMDGIMDGIVYGVAAGLGFAATENFLYGLGWGVSVTLFRAFLTPFVHGTWTAIVGVGLGLKSEGRIQSVSGFLILAVVLHFIWDYYAFISAYNPLYNLLLLFLLGLNGLILWYLMTIARIEEFQKWLWRRFWRW